MTIETLATEYPQGPLEYQANFLVPRSQYYNVSITARHWQLKDLVCRSSRSNTVMFPSSSKLCSLDFHVAGVKPTNVVVDTSRYVSTLASFEDSPRCIKEQDGVTVVGGLAEMSRAVPMQQSTSTSSITRRHQGKWKGLLGVHIADTGFTENGHVGTLINNCVTIDKVANSQYRSLVCNNDQNLYFVDITSCGGISPSTSANMGVALNHASLSPDQKTVVCVGDSSRIFLLHPEEDVRDVSKRQVIATQSDSGFSTCWKDSGYQFSSCFQEGVNFIYDLRNVSRPMHEIVSTRRQTQNGAFRVCKFSGGTDDLLFISEHHGRVHVVDTRDFLSHQVVMLPKHLYLYDDCYYNQPIVKNYRDVCDVQSQLGYLSASRRFIAGIDISRLQGSKFFNYSPGDCPKRYSAEDDREYDGSPQPLASYDNYSHTATTYDSPSSQQAASTMAYSPLNDPFYYLDSELEVCGLEVVSGGNGTCRSLVIGSEEGIVHWDIDSWKRRCFPSYELA